MEVIKVELLEHNRFRYDAHFTAAACIISIINDDVLVAPCIVNIRCPI